MKTLTDSQNIALIAVVVGALVKTLSTEKVSALLDKLPVSFVNRIPKFALPWVSLALGVALMALDAKLNGGLATWKEALATALQGAIAGGFAIAGHEAVFKAPARIKEHRASSMPPPAPPESKL